jgi:hypothetical protein
MKQFTCAKPMLAATAKIGRSSSIEPRETLDPQAENVSKLGTMVKVYFRLLDRVKGSESNLRAMPFESARCQK